MIRFAIITNFNITEKADAAMKVAEKLYSLGECEIVLAFYNKEKIAKLNKDDARFIYLPSDQVYRQSDIIIVLGGDGTIIESSRRAAPYKKPIIGLNLGRLGYMAELDMNETDMLASLFDGNYTLESRSMLSVEVIGSGNKTRFTSYALNDAVVSNGSVARIVDLELYCNDKLMSAYRADGIIVSTPTGSTAYSMSAGGPILDPVLKCFCVTPICPHSLSARSVILPDDCEIKIKNVCRREKLLYLTVDGKNNCELFYGDTVKITNSELKTDLIRIKERMFYKILRQKMGDYS